MSVSSYGRIYKALRYMLRFCISFEFNLYYPFLENGCPYGSTMVLLIRAMVYSHRLSIQPPVYLASQFVMHVLTGSCELPDWIKGWS